jgi:predicted ribosomally synthesized peptide with SipW-like signal peptide
MRARRPLSVRSRLLASVALVGLLLAAVSAVVHSAFTSTVRSAGNTFEAGTITLTGSADSGSALFSFSGLQPGPVGSRCLGVSYASTGGLAAAVRLYGTSHGGLEEALIVTITRGTFSGAAPTDGGCAGFVGDPGDPLFHAPMSQLPQNYASGVPDPDPSWTDGESAAYRIDVELADTDQAQGGSTTHELVFEAHSV